ncbi:hypothetical protein NDU88_002645 [Pleurodeles waltl]|uniref:Thioredoxin-like fold domain-containing protein n=1 Tax=Pleurodeles waltl TaxID=8319 RepID=A0AAV7UCZ4_PLEWA|nr:hypothetical protein NDU88_002645 [Pleurodeles waltl]
MSEAAATVALLGESLVSGGEAPTEVDVRSLASAPGALLGLFFGCSLSGPCRQFSASLADFYERFRRSRGPGRLEIVFVSSDQDHEQWREFTRDMPWVCLPHKERHRKVRASGDELGVRGQRHGTGDLSCSGCTQWHPSGVPIAEGGGLQAEETLRDRFTVEGGHKLWRT